MLVCWERPSRRPVLSAQCALGGRAGSGQHKRAREWSLNAVNANTVALETTSAITGCAAGGEGEGDGDEGGGKEKGKGNGRGSP